MRGKDPYMYFIMVCIGITPAYAGKSEIFELSHNLKKDHPRLCGEKHNLFPQNRINHRITPAYAGKRFEQGDKTYNVHGSPPPMRGKVYPRRQRDAL